MPTVRIQTLVTMTEHTIDEPQSFVTEKLVEMFDNYYPMGGSYKKRSRDDMNRKVVRVINPSNNSRAKTVDLDGKTKLNTNFVEEPLEREIKEYFNLPDSVAGTGMSRRGGEDRGDRREKEERRRRRSRGGSEEKKDGEYSTRSSERSSAGKSMELMETSNDGSITMMPPFTKEEAEYEQHHPHDYHCEGCVHFVEGGGCTLVQGEIDPRAHCERFFADVGMFGNSYSGDILNLKLWGEEYEFDMQQIERFANMIEEEMKRRG
jgi:hypothetical protein